MVAFVRPDEVEQIFQYQNGVLLFCIMDKLV